MLGELATAPWPGQILDRFERVVRGRSVAELERGEPSLQVDVAARLRAMW